MSESIVADTLIEILTYSPQDQADATRIIRTMTAQANGVDFSRVLPFPAVQTHCNLFAGRDLTVIPSGRREGVVPFEEIRHKLIARRGEWKFEGAI